MSLLDRFVSRVAAKSGVFPATLCLGALLCSLAAADSLADEIPVDEPADTSHADTELAEPTPEVDKSVDTSLADTEPESAPAALNVGEVSVTATRAERDVLEVPGNVTVINREQIEQSGLREVPELLRRMTGVHVTNLTGSPDGYAMEVRGFNDGGGNGSSTLVLVDGRRMNEADSGNVDWSRIRLDNVERIEIVRGPASAAWGDNAIGGVVQIFTRRGKGDATATLKGNFGSYDNYGGSLYAGGTQGPVTASLFADGLDSDNYRDRSDFWSAQVKGDVRVELGENLSVAVSGGYLEDERDRPGALSQQQISMYGRRAANPDTVGDELKRDRYHIDGRIEWTPRKNMLFTLRPYYQERNDDGQITSVVTWPPPEHPVAFLNDTKIETFGVNPQGQIDHKWSWGTNRLIFGTDILRDDIRRDDTSVNTDTGMQEYLPSNKKSKRRIYAGYVQDELQVGKQVTLSAGLRYDSTEVSGKDLINGDRFETADGDDDFWSPKAGIVWRFRSDASAYFSYARGFRMPNVDEAFGFFGFNEGLDPEKSDSYEIGAKLRREQIHFDLTLYRLDVKDQILFNHEIDAAFGLFANPRSVNIDKVRHQGVEVSTRIFPWKWLEIYGSYTYEDNEIQRDHFSIELGEVRPSLDGKRLPITPEHRGNFGVNLTLPYWIELGFNGNITGSRYMANDLLNEFSKLSSFAVFDTRAAFRPKIGKHVRLDVIFRVNNLLDNKYEEFGGERTFVRNEFGFYPSPTRNYMGTIAVTVTR
ncbi:MAG: TonB-dependent receptor [Deltaproteobacteria bacterium]|nr:TonB-dependent receptor [Deltaproteobacteria bacterium]MBW2693519.1 TonB-dependent receptor [Deltaproteobacteria bacterium]